MGTTRWLPLFSAARNTSTIVNVVLLTQNGKNGQVSSRPEHRKKEISRSREAPIHTLDRIPQPSPKHTAEPAEDQEYFMRMIIVDYQVS